MASSYYEMKNGLVVMQAEDGKFVNPNNPQNKTWKETKQFNGEDGTVLQWTGKDFFNASNAGKSQTAPLEYHFEVDEPGTYFLSIRAIKPNTGEESDRNNDFFYKFEGQSWTKIFFSGGPNQFKFATKFDKNHKQGPAKFEVTQKMINENDGIFTLGISARSHMAGMDEIHIKKGSASKDDNAPTSKLIKGDGSSSGGGSNPPPPPQDDPPKNNNNDDPNAKNDTASTEHDSLIKVDVLKNDSDPNGDKLTLTNVSYSGNTSFVSIKDGKIEVNPLSKATNERVETITYTVSDGKGGKDTATLKVSVGAKDDDTPPPPPPPSSDDGNSPPVAKNDTASTEQNKTINVNVLKNDSDPDGDDLTIVDVAYSGISSLVSIVNNLIRVNPLKKFDNDRVEEITYTVEDEDGAQSSAKLFVEVGDADSTPPSEPDGSLSLFIADIETDKVLRKLEDGDKISAKDLSDEFTFFATTEDEDVFKFVDLTFEGRTTRESIEPYAFLGDKNGDFDKGLDLDKGSYDLVVKGYDDDNKLIETLDVGFDII